jgi:hypothetical protein
VRNSPGLGMCSKLQRPFRCGAQVSLEARKPCPAVAARKSHRNGGIADFALKKKVEVSPEYTGGSRIAEAVPAKSIRFCPAAGVAGARPILAVLRLLHAETPLSSGFFIKKKPPCTPVASARELENRSKAARFCYAEPWSQDASS